MHSATSSVLAAQQTSSLNNRAFPSPLCRSNWTTSSSSWQTP